VAERYIVQCLRHGVESAGKQVVVPRPQNKAERRDAGCPHCANERRQSQPQES